MGSTLCTTTTIVDKMSSRYIARRYGDTSEARSRSTSASRTATSQVHDNLSFYSRGSSAARSRSSTPSKLGGAYTLDYNTKQEYKGKVNSIYERDPLFKDFVTSLPSSTSLYNSGNMSNLKDQFQTMVQDKWGRKQMEDPSVCHDMALKASSWSNYIGRSSEAASESLGRKHSTSRLEQGH